MLVSVSSRICFACCRTATDTTCTSPRWMLCSLSQVFHTPCPPVFSKLPIGSLVIIGGKCCDKLSKRKDVRVKLICRLRTSTNSTLCSYMLTEYNSYCTHKQGSYRSWKTWKVLEFYSGICEF